MLTERNDERSSVEEQQYFTDVVSRGHVFGRCGGVDVYAELLLLSPFLCDFVFVLMHGVLLYIRTHAPPRTVLKGWLAA